MISNHQRTKKWNWVIIKGPLAILLKQIAEGSWSSAQMSPFPKERCPNTKQMPGHLHAQKSWCLMNWETALPTRSCSQWAPWKVVADSSSWENDKSIAFEVGPTWTQVLTLPITTCMTMGKTLSTFTCFLLHKMALKMSMCTELSRGPRQYIRDRFYIKQPHGQHALGSHSILDSFLQGPHLKTWAYLTKDQGTYQLLDIQCPKINLWRSDM